jgi:hypothetical protein
LLSKLKIISFRWLVLLIFFPGILCLEINFPGANDVIVWASAVSLLGCSLLLFQLDKPIGKTLWAWLVLFVFIMGYYVKFLFISSAIDNPTLYFLYGKEIDWLNYELLNDSIKWTCIGFFVFCAVAAMLLCFPFKQYWINTRVATRNSSVSVSRFRFIMLSTVLLFIIASYLPLVFGFGQMGLEHHKLPYRLDAFITRFRVTLMPIVFLLLLWISDTRKDRIYWFVTLGSFFILVLLDSFVRTSRTGLLLAALPVAFLWGFSDRFTKKRRNFIICVVALTVFLYPLITIMRTVRITGGSLGVPRFQEAIQYIDYKEVLSVAMVKFTTRVGGLDGLAHNLNFGPTSMDPARLLWLLDYETISKFHTYEVVGIPSGQIEGRSPGLLGGFVLAGGMTGMVMLVIVYTILLWLAWQGIVRSPIAPVVLAFFSANILFYTSEGKFGIQDPLSWLIAILIVHWVYEWLIVKSKIDMEFSGGSPR